MKKSVHTTAHKILRERLISARKAAGFTQQELADQLGRPQSFVAKYEGGERRLDVVEFLRVVRVIGARPKSILDKVAQALDV